MRTSSGWKNRPELPPRWISHFGGGGGCCWAAEKSFAPMLSLALRETCYGIETARAEHTARGASARAYKLRGYDGLVKRCAALLINSAAVHISKAANKNKVHVAVVARKLNCLIWQGTLCFCVIFDGWFFDDC
jgi:hypothetical protein